MTQDPQYFGIDPALSQVLGANPRVPEWKVPGRRGQGDPAGDARLPRPRRLPDADVQLGNGDQDGDAMPIPRHVQSQGK